MNEHRPRARKIALAALVALAAMIAAGLALSLRASPQTSTAANPVGAEQAQSQPATSTTTTRTTATSTDAQKGAPATSPEARVAIDPSEYLQHGSREPLVPRTLEVKAEIDEARGAATAEPLVPRTLEVEAQPDETRGGARSAEPLVPRTLEIENPKTTPR